MNQPSNASRFVLLAVIWLLGCRTNHQPTGHAIATASIKRVNQPAPPVVAEPSHMTVAATVAADAGSPSATTVHQTIDFATCRASNTASNEQDPGDGMIRCPLSPGLYAQQDGSACVDINRLRNDKDEDLFNSEWPTAAGIVFIPDRKFELYLCQGRPFAVLQTGELFRDSTSAESPCHEKRPLRRTYLVQDVPAQKRYDGVTVSRARALLAQIAQNTRCATIERAFALNHTVMLAIADQQTPLSSLVDDQRGIVFIDESNPPVENHKPKPGGHLCGARMRQALASIQRALSDKKFGLRATYDEERLSCNQRPALECTWRGASEGSPSVHFYFRSASGTPNKLQLRAITELDELLVDPQLVAVHQSDALKFIDAHDNDPCP